MILAILGTAQLMVVLDATIVNIALPSAQRRFISATTTASGSSPPTRSRSAACCCSVAGSATVRTQMDADRRALGFAIASAVGGAAQSFGMLAAARAVQGAFGALLAPAALSLLTTTFTEPSERAKAFGVFAAIAGSGASIGLLLGGVLTQALSWRYCMYVNLVFATVAVAGALILVSNSRPRTRPRLDIPGTVAVVAGLFALVYGFSHAQTTGWSDQLTIGLLASGVLLLAVFVALEAASAIRCCRCGWWPTAIAARRSSRSASPAAAIFAVVPVPHLLPAADPRLLADHHRARVPADDGRRS